MKSFSAVLRVWVLSLLGCAALAALCFVKIDVPVAHRVWHLRHHLSSLNAAFGTTLILTAESVVVLALIIARLVRGHISRSAETLTMACLASICAYGINDQVLKPFFGVPAPVDVVHGARHALHFMQGFSGSSFPSGHMVLAGAFAGVFMRIYSGSIRLLCALLLLAAVLLVLGDWHFISDVIAGGFLGISAGILAGEGWAVHMMGSRY